MSGNALLNLVFLMVNIYLAVVFHEKNSRIRCVVCDSKFNVFTMEISCGWTWSPLL